MSHPKKTTSRKFYQSNVDSFYHLDFNVPLYLQKSVPFKLEVLLFHFLFMHYTPALAIVNNNAVLTNFRVYIFSLKSPKSNMILVCELADRSVDRSLFTYSPFSIFCRHSIDFDLDLALKQEKFLTKSFKLHVQNVNS